MKSKKTIIASAVLGALLLTGVSGTGVALAKSTSSQPPIVEKLAKKLNVSTNDVSAAFDELQQERRQEARKRFEEQLDKAVSDGKITAEQKETILKKQDEIAKKHQELQKLKQELRSWADENGIDQGLLFLRGPGRGPGGPRGGACGPGPIE